ncbi:hypothetical protein B0181_11525 [Moraxella caviae]|uniref:Uncharacterized protein n=1 Tax=Moraxella caviae TaxID=34060 RepID=A0A1S9ZTN8_9GAMM|nr:hypothetical protein [Moraxella caviae]OOR86727.1 hypothetical protein B0181_11525 [Moraxella caviae]STZ13576.1 Uncharacterised protein [Moraxella caviae]
MKRTDAKNDELFLEAYAKQEAFILRTISAFGYKKQATEKEIHEQKRTFNNMIRVYKILLIFCYVLLVLCMHYLGGLINISLTSPNNLIVGALLLATVFFAYALYRSIQELNSFRDLGNLMFLGDIYQATIDTSNQSAT